MMPFWMSTAITLIMLLLSIGFALADHRKNDRLKLVMMISFVIFVTIVGLGCFIASVPVIFHALNIPVKEGVTKIFSYLIMILGVISLPIFVSSPNIGQNNNGKFGAMWILIGVGVIGGCVAALL